MENDTIHDELCPIRQMNEPIVICDYSPLVFSQLFRLLSDVYDSKVTQEDLELHYLGFDQQIITAMQGKSLLGCAFLDYKTDYIRNYRTVFVTYVAVDSKCRHQGIGLKLFDEIEKRARSRCCAAIELTSADSRTAAHAFYHSLLFSKKKTTVFIKEL